ncbi:MAG: class I SAM-dependent methyltransferase [Akkermansiaceae bacterium]
MARFADTHFKNPHTAADLTRLRDFLKETLSKTDIAKDPQSLQLLNLACGRADETAVLAEVFGGLAQEISITGVDIRDREIDTARERWKQLASAECVSEAEMNLEFFVQDGSKLSDVKGLSDQFDIAFMRHQNFYDGDTTWSKIYDEALHRLHDGGHLVITSYFDLEHKLALRALQNLGAELVHTERNLLSRKLLDVPHKTVDRHLAIFKKP